MTFAQSFSVSRGVEDHVLNKVSINQAIDDAIPTLYKRMIMKLHTVDGWNPEIIAECVGLPRNDVCKTIDTLRPRILTAIKEVRIPA